MNSKLRGLVSAAFMVFFLGATAAAPQSTEAGKSSTARLGLPALSRPISVYDNWSAYDELSDNVPLTQDLSMRELDQLLRLKKAGARFDYYAMDAFWFDPKGGYRTWKKPNWPDGPDAWIEKCRQNGIEPGLWFSTNTLVHLDAAPQWRDSLNKQGNAMSMFEGGFLPDFMNVLQYWYDRGVRMFLFDFADLTAATPQFAATLSKQEIIRRNSLALRDALEAFRRRNPGVVLEAFNGFGGVMDSTYYPFPFKDPVDLDWLKVFDALYCGDPRPADVPEMDFWRSVDIYADHQVLRYRQSGVPLERIDATSFMPGKTSTIYRRAFHEWKGSLLLMLAHGGWINTTYGNLELMSDRDVRWYARAQSLFLHLQSQGRMSTFGGIPGDAQIYGFRAQDTGGSVYTVVNPAQNVASIKLPVAASDHPASRRGRILFRDAGFEPVLTGDALTLGPGQMAMIGYGKYASPAYDFGIQQGIAIPRNIRPVAADFHSTGKGIIEASIKAPANGTLRLVMQQYSPDGSLRRTWSGENMGKIFVLRAAQAGKVLQIRENYDRVIWSGLSWAVGEIPANELRRGQPLVLNFQSTEKDPVNLKGQVYVVQY
jgi:hypothetical protein